MAEKSMLDIAYDQMVGKKSTAFSTIWNAVCKELKLSKEDADKKVANFYTLLSLDGRFVALGNNKWGLRDALPYDKVHVDLSDAYKDIDESHDDVDEEEDEKKEEESSSNEDESFN